MYCNNAIVAQPKVRRNTFLFIRLIPFFETFDVSQSERRVPQRGTRSKRGTAKSAEKYFLTHGEPSTLRSFCLPRTFFVRGRVPKRVPKLRNERETTEIFNENFFGITFVSQNKKPLYIFNPLFLKRLYTTG